MHVVLRGRPLVLLVCALGVAANAAVPVYQLTTVAGSDVVGDAGQATAAEIAQPEGMAVDASGNLYIADAANHRVRMVTPSGIISTVAGNGHPGFGGDNGPAAASQLDQPYDVALDSSGSLYIADYGNQRVRRIDPAGNITTFAGGGPGGAAGDGGPAISASLVGPRNVAVDASGNLYISEFDAHRVRMVDASGSIRTVAGTGIAGFSGDGGPAVSAQLAFPAGLAFDAAGNLYIVDSANVRIRKVLPGGVISTVCNRQNFGMPFVQLSGLAAGPAGNLFIPDAASAYVWQWSPLTGITRVAGMPGSNPYTGDGKPALQTAFASPVSAALDPAGNLYIAEIRRVRVIAAQTQIVNTIAGNGAFGYGGDGGPAASAVLDSPMGIAWNNGVLYFADQQNHRIRAISGGNIATVAGDGIASYSGDGLPATSAGLSAPTAVSFDSAGNLYIADTHNQRVRRVDTSGIISTFAGNGTVDGFGGEGDPATTVPVTAPEGVAADASGEVYISDTDHNRVICVEASGEAGTVAGTGTAGLSELYSPAGLAIDNSGNLYIADSQNHRIEILTAGGALAVFAGTGVPGFSGDGGPAAAAQLNDPSAVAADPYGNVFIADTGNHRIRLVTPDGNIATIAGTGDPGYNGDTGIALQMALFNPGGIAADSQGNVWVSDTGNNRIRLLTPTQTKLTPPALVDVTFASAASLQPGPLAPGEIFSIFGQGIGPANAATGAFDSTGKLATSLAGVQVMFDNTPAPLYYVQAQQINAQVPYELAGQASAQMQVVYGNVLVAAAQVAIVPAQPALFTVNNGVGNLAALNQDGTVNSARNPAPRGTIVTLYATGEGQTDPSGITGLPSELPFPSPLLPVSLTIGDLPAVIIFAGEAPGFVGLLQIDAQLPSGYLPAGDLPVMLRVGSFSAPAGATIAVN